MEAGIAERAPGGLFAGDEEAVDYNQEPHASGVGDREVDDDFDRVVGLEDVERRRALAGERFGGVAASELAKNLPDLVRKIADFRRHGDDVQARWTHWPSSHTFDSPLTRSLGADLRRTGAAGGPAGRRAARRRAQSIRRTARRDR